MFATFALLIHLFLTLRTAEVQTAAQTRETRISGGHRVDISEIPYQVALNRSDFPMQLTCGGSIITPSHILTAAHCVYHVDKGLLTVLAGSSYAPAARAGIGQVRAVADVHIHPLYTPFTDGNPALNILGENGRNDISILKLTTPLQYGRYVAPIALPDPTLKIMAGVELLASGWSNTIFIGNGSRAQQALLKVQVPAVAWTECHDMYQEEGVRIEYNFTVLSSMLCAGTEGKSICNGESGGPLVTTETDTGTQLPQRPRMLVGLVSFGAFCGPDGFGYWPSVYTRVSSFRSFIKAVAGV